MDMIGLIEKIRYDKLYEDVPATVIASLDVYIASLKSTISQKDPSLYDKIEQAKLLYITDYAYVTNVYSAYKDVFYSQRYTHFMSLLKEAFSKDLFALSPYGFSQEFQKLLLFRMPSSHIIIDDEDNCDFTPIYPTASVRNIETIKEILESKIVFVAPSFTVSDVPAQEEIVPKKQVLNPAQIDPTT